VGLYLRDRENGNSILELIAEADPTKRKVNGETYVSAIPSYPPPDKQALDEYRKTIDAWLAARPAIAARYADLAREYETQRVARTFIAENVAKQLEAKPGLSQLAVKRLVQYLEDTYNPNPRGFSEKTGWAPRATTLPSAPPDEWLVAQLDPDVERDRVRRIAEADALLDRYHFDTTFLSPLTGLAYSQRVGWRDDSTWSTLGFPAPPTMDEQVALGRHSFERDSYRTVVDSPRTEAKLIRFSVPLQPGQARTLRVAYRALAEVDDIEMGGGYDNQIVHVRYILKTARNWKSFGPIELTVTMPKSGLVVMEPAPSWQSDLKDDRVQFTAKITSPDSNLRIAWLPVGEEARSRLFDCVGRSDLADLRKLEPAVKHPQARRVLAALTAMAHRPSERDAMRVEYSTLREPHNLMRAGFTPDEAFRLGVPGRDNWRLREQRARYNHVQELAKSGWTYVESVMQPQTYFSNAPSERITGWRLDDRRIAAEWAAAIPGEAPTPAARLARSYLAMFATDRPTDADARAFMDAARGGEDTLLRIALMLINEFPGDPRPFKPLVDEAAARPKPTGTDRATVNFQAAARNAALKIDRYKPPTPAPVEELTRRGKQLLEAATRATAATSRPAN
jgi:hypothetical protein